MKHKIKDYTVSVFITVKENKAIKHCCVEKWSTLNNKSQNALMRRGDANKMLSLHHKI